MVRGGAGETLMGIKSLQVHEAQSPLGNSLSSFKYNDHSKIKEETRPESGEKEHN